MWTQQYPTSRLQVRFNDKVYSPTKMVCIDYANRDYFSITLDAGGDLEIKSEFNGTIQKELDPSRWSIVGRNNQNPDNFVKVLIGNTLGSLKNGLRCR